MDGADSCVCKETETSEKVAVIQVKEQGVNISRTGQR